MTNPLHNITSAASMLSSTLLDPPIVIPEPKNRVGMLALGAIAAVGLGAICLAGRSNDRRSVEEKRDRKPSHTDSLSR